MHRTWLHYIVNSAVLCPGVPPEPRRREQPKRCGTRRPTTSSWRFGSLFGFPQHSIAAHGSSFAPPLPPGRSSVQSSLPALPVCPVQVLSCAASGSAAASARPPLVFIHGSYHAAWCWAEHFLPYFAQRGHDCYALSLRGQARLPPPRRPAPSVMMENGARDGCCVPTLCSHLP